MSEEFGEKDALAERIRSEANIADRPGQFGRLEAIADAVSAIEQGLAALRAEMVGMGNAGASLVSRSWIVHRIDAMTRVTPPATTEETP